MSFTETQVEAAAQKVASEMGFDWSRMDERYRFACSKENVRKYWRDVATIVLEAAENAE